MSSFIHRHQALLVSSMSCIVSCLAIGIISKVFVQPAQSAAFEKTAQLHPSTEPIEMSSVAKETATSGAKAHTQVQEFRQHDENSKEQSIWTTMATWLLEAEYRHRTVLNKGTVKMNVNSPGSDSSDKRPSENVDQLQEVDPGMFFALKEKALEEKKRALQEQVNYSEPTNPADHIAKPLFTNDWLPPAWFPAETAHELWALENVDLPAKHSKGPKLYSRAAIIFDVDSGEVLWEKNADARRSVASLTKLHSALTMMAYQGPHLHDSWNTLDETHCLSKTISPNIRGAITKFSPDSCTTGWDLLGASLLVSDNGAAMALADVSGVDHSLFVDKMNTVATELGMNNSEFADLGGFNDENISTARDVLKMTLASAFHPTISLVSSAKSWEVRYSKERSKTIGSTNKAHRKGLEFLIAKTGYTDTARHGFTAVYRQKGRTIGFTVLGAWFSHRRWKDVAAVIDWTKNKS